MHPVVVLLFANAHTADGASLETKPKLTDESPVRTPVPDASAAVGVTVFRAPMCPIIGARFVPMIFEKCPASVSSPASTPAGSLGQCVKDALHACEFAPVHCTVVGVTAVPSWETGSMYQYTRAPTIDGLVHVKYM
jgi:hypothetical protein